MTEAILRDFERRGPGVVRRRGGKGSSGGSGRSGGSGDSGARQGAEPRGADSKKKKTGRKGAGSGSNLGNR